jgi:hypothetical protein
LRFKSQRVRRRLAHRPRNQAEHQEKKAK